MRRGSGGIALFCLIALARLYGDDSIRIGDGLDTSRFPTRWDNVEGAPWLVGGPSPKWDASLRFHVFRLRPHEVVVLHVPIDRLLRVVFPGITQRSHIEVTIDGGSGMEIPQAGVQGDDGSWFFPTRRFGSHLFRLRSTDNKSRNVAVFVGRADTTFTRQLAMGSSTLGSDPVRLRREGELIGRRYWRLGPGKPIRVRVQGGGELSLLTRFEFPQSESSRQQSYRISIEGAEDPNGFEVQTVPDSVPTWVDGRPVCVGTSKVTRFLVNSSVREITLRASRNVWCRLFRSDDSVYFAAANRSQHSRPSDLTSLSLGDAPSVESVGSISESFRFASVPATVFEAIRGAEPADLQIAAAYFRAMATSFAVDADSRRLARSWYERLTRRRHHLPRHMAAGRQIDWRSYVIRNARPAGDESTSTKVAKEQFAAALTSLGSGAFAVVPETQARADEYHVGARDTGVWLRLVARQESQGAEFWLQADDQPPVLIRCSTRLPARWQRTSTSFDAAASLVVHGNGRWNPLDIHAALSQYQRPHAFVEVWHGEYFCVAGVRTIKLWRDEGAAPVAVSVQSRSGAPIVPTESEFLDELEKWRRNAPPGESLLPYLQRLWAARERNISDESTASAGALNEVLAWIDASCDDDVGGVHVNPPRKYVFSDIDHSSSEEIESNAMAAEQTGDWLRALEHWTDAFRQADPVRRRRIDLARLRCLLELGEHWFAEEQMLGIVQSSRDFVLRDAVRNRLLDHVRASGNVRKEHRLIASFLCRSSDTDLVSRMVELSAERGATRRALSLGLILPAWKQPVEILLRSAYEEQWWDTFEAFLPLLESESASYWRGIRLATQGAYEGAIDRLNQGGPRGQELASFVSSALAVRRSLNATDLETRVRGVGQWLKLEASRPGPRRWRSASDLIAEFASSCVIETLDQRVRTLWFVADSDRKVKLQVFGPTRLRVRSRRLYGVERTDAEDSWLTVDDGSKRRVFPLNVTRPSDSTRLPGQPEVRPGLEQEFVFVVDSGLHTFEIGSTSPLAIRVYEEEASLRFGILPRVTDEAMQLSLADPAVVDSGELIVTGQRVEGITQDKVVRGALYRIPPIGVSRSRRTDSDPILSDLRQEFGASSGVTETEDERVVRELLARSVGDHRETIVSLQSRLEIDAEERLRSLAYVAEHDGRLRDGAVAVGFEVMNRERDDPRLRSIWSRLRRGYSWQRVVTLNGSAGIRTLPLDGWRPESPGLRVRSQFLRSMERGETLLLGTDALLVTVRQRQPTSLKLRVAAEAVRFRPVEVTWVRYELNDWESHEVYLSKETPRREIVLPIPAGEHRVRISAVSPVTNQFIAVKVVGIETSSDHDLSVVGGSESQHPTRNFHVASTESPIRLTVVGPKCVRIDEQRGGGTVTSYRIVTKEIEEIVLRPRGDEKEALFRLFELSAKPSAQQEAPEIAREEEPEDLPPPQLNPRLRLGVDSESEVSVTDGIELGGQEDGTLSLAIKAERRRMFEEDGDVIIVAEQFVELDAVHRKQADSLPAHFETGLLGRRRERGGPTIGAWERIRYAPDWLPVTLGAQGEVFAQWPSGDPIVPSGPLEWSYKVEAGASRQVPFSLNAFMLPSVRVFGRHLSLSDKSRFDPGDLDQDVFSEFKYDHRYGLKLSDTFTYRPWIDTQWRMRASVTTNEDFNVFRPDSVRYSVDWGQYLAGFQIDVGYQLTYFFDDSDRSNSRTRHSVSLQATHDVWSNVEHRLEIGGVFRQDFPEDRSTGMVFLAIHFGKGRGYRDFRPGEVDFVGLRERRIPDRGLNRLATQRD